MVAGLLGQVGVMAGAFNDSQACSRPGILPLVYCQQRGECRGHMSYAFSLERQVVRSTQGVGYNLPRVRTPAKVGLRFVFLVRENDNVTLVGLQLVATQHGQVRIQDVQQASPSGQWEIRLGYYIPYRLVIYR